MTDNNIPTKRLYGWDSWEGAADTIRVLVFGVLHAISHDLVEFYQSDYAHDVRWIDKHVNGPMTFYFGADDCGTAIGTDRELVTAYRDHAWECTLRVEVNLEYYAENERGEWFLDVRPIKADRWPTPVEADIVSREGVNA